MGLPQNGTKIININPIGIGGSIVSYIPKEYGSGNGTYGLVGSNGSSFPKTNIPADVLNSNKSIQDVLTDQQLQGSLNAFLQDENSMFDQLSPGLKPGKTYGGPKPLEANPSIYSIETGFSQDTPVFVASTEFLPIERETKPFTIDDRPRSAIDRDYALNVKEKSKLITVENCVNIFEKKSELREILDIDGKGLGGVTGASSSGLKQDVANYFNFTKSEINKILNALSDAISSLDISGYSHKAFVDFFPNAKNDVYYGFYNYLVDDGWPKEFTLSPTTLYEQFIIELFRDIVTHTQASSKAKTNTSLKPLTDDFDPEMAYVKNLFNLRGVFYFGDSTKDTSISNALIAQANNLEKFNQVPSYLYTKNRLLRIKGPSVSNLVYLKGPQLKNEITKYSIGADNRPTLYALFGNTVENQTQSSNDPYDILPTLLAKEIYYSRALTNQDLVDELVKLDVPVRTDGSHNYAIWNSLIGRSLYQDVLKFHPVKYDDDYNKLIDLSRYRQVIIPPPETSKEPFEYRVLTFETFDIPNIDDSEKKLTQGSLYFIDSALRLSLDKSKFDTSRLNILFDKLNDCNHRIDLIKRMCGGGDIFSTTETLAQKVIVKNELAPLTVFAGTITKSTDPMSRIKHGMSPLMSAIRKSMRTRFIEYNPSQYQYTGEGSGFYTLEVNADERANMFNSQFALGQVGIGKLSDEAKLLVPATIFSLAYETYAKKGQSNDPSLLLALFQLIIRNMYLKLAASGQTPFSLPGVSYDAFKSAWTGPTTWSGEIGIGDGGGNDFALSFFNSDATLPGTGQEIGDQNTNTNVGLQGGLYTNPSLTNKNYGYNQYGESVIKNDTLMIERSTWTDKLILEEGANTPELLIDALLYRAKCQYQLAPVPSPQERNKSSTGLVNFIPIKSTENIGFPNLRLLEEDAYSTDENFAILNALVKAGALPPQDSTKGSGFNQINWLNSFQLPLYQYDFVTLADDPVFQALFLNGDSFIKELGSGLGKEPEGLFALITDLMSDMFLENIYSNGDETPAQPGDLFDIGPGLDVPKTLYGSIEKGTILFNYFLCICKFISSVTPDVFDGFWTYDTKPQVVGDLFNGATSTGLRFGGYRLKIDYQRLFKRYRLSDGAEGKDSTIYELGSNSFLESYYKDVSTISNKIDLLEGFVTTATKKISTYRELLKTDFSGYLNELNDALDTGPEQFEETTKRDLANLSLGQEQLILSSYMSSEFVDRYSKSNKSEEKLRIYPDFANYPEKFNDYLPLNDIDVVSYSTMSDIFKSSDEFGIFKGNNKRILSVGLPPRLLRSLLGNPSKVTASKNANFYGNLFKIIVTKFDILNSGINFKPKEFLFEANRFPTRIASNWKSLSPVVGTLTQIDPETGLPVNIGKLPNGMTIYDIPMKLYSYGDFILCKDFSEGFPFYGDTLSPELKEEIWKNHATSFLLEEYIKWFTALNLNETQYHNFNKSAYSQNKFPTLQYANYLQSVGGQFDASNLFGKNIPSTIQSDDLQQLTLDSQDTLKNYFKNDTIFIGQPELRRRTLYPKKFDRVFNLIIDPDDFEISGINDPEDALKYQQQGIVKKIVEKYVSVITGEEYKAADPGAKKSEKGGKFKDQVDNQPPPPIQYEAIEKFVYTRQTQQTNIYFDYYAVQIIPWAYTPEYDTSPIETIYLDEDSKSFEASAQAKS